MSAGIGDAMQIIDIIQKVRKIYLRIQETGKEIDDAFEDVKTMEIELRFLQRTFGPKKAGSYPEILSTTATITTQFRPLKKSMKQLRGLFDQFAKLAKNPFGKSIWAFTKKRDEVFAIQRGFASYRSIFQRSLILLNEESNKEQAWKAKEIKDQARKYAKERKDEDKARKKDNQKMAKELKELKEMMKKAQKPEPVKTVPEQITGEDQIREWLVNQKGLDVKEANSLLGGLSEKNESKKTAKSGKEPKAKIEEQEKNGESKKAKDKQKDDPNADSQQKGPKKESKKEKEKQKEAKPPKEKKMKETTAADDKKEKPKKESKQTREGENDAKPPKKPKIPVIITQDVDKKPEKQKDGGKDQGRQTKDAHRRSKSQENLPVPEKERRHSKSESRVGEAKEEKVKGQQNKQEPEKPPRDLNNDEAKKGKKDRDGAGDRTPKPKKEQERSQERNYKDQEAKKVKSEKRDESREPKSGDDSNPVGKEKKDWKLKEHSDEKKKQDQN